MRKTFKLESALLAPRLTTDQRYVLNRVTLRWGLTTPERLNVSRYLRSRRICADYDRLSAVEKAAIENIKAIDGRL
jgi:hypothetical protein